jgi:uncharacterized repeat protein (TIGR01451 family)
MLGLGIVVLMVTAMPAWSVVNLSGPAVLDRSGETYVVTGDFSCAGTAFTIAAPGVTLDLGGHTIQYAMGSAQGHGVWIAPGWQSGTDKNATDAEIKNGTFTQHATSTARYCDAIYGNEVPNTAGPRIYGITFNTHTACSKGIHLKECGSGVQIYSCVFNVSNLTYEPDQEICEAVRLIDAYYGTATTPGVVRDNVINWASHGISVVGNSGRKAQYVQIYGNVIHHHAPADFARNCMGIILFAADHCLVHDNTIQTESGQGILIDGTGAGGADYNEIYDNNVDISENQAGDLHRVKGIFVRYGSDYNKIHGNTVICRSVLQNNIFPFVLGRVPNVELCYGNEVYNNTFTNLYNGAPCYSAALDVRDVGSGNYLHDNLLTSNNHAIELYESSHYPALISHNTLVKGPNPAANYAAIFMLSDSGSPAGPHAVRDSVLSGGAALSQAAYGEGGGSCDIEWTLTVKAQDGLGAAVAGAAVQIRDRYGALVAGGATAADGAFSAAVRQYTESSAGDTTYTPHTVTATKLGYSDGSATVTVDASKQVTITLPSSSTLSLTKSADRSSAAPGEVILYTITYRNDTSQTAYSAAITDAIPANTTYVAGSAKLNGVTIQPDPLQSGALVIPLGNVPAGEGGVVTFQVTVS